MRYVLLAFCFGFGLSFKYNDEIHSIYENFIFSEKNKSAVDMEYESIYSDMSKEIYELKIQDKDSLPMNEKKELYSKIIKVYDQKFSMLDKVESKYNQSPKIKPLIVYDKRDQGQYISLLEKNH